MRICLLLAILTAGTSSAALDDTAPGALAQYFSSIALPTGFVPGEDLPQPAFSEVLENGFGIGAGSTIGSSPLTDDASVRIVGKLPIPLASTFTFYAHGGESQTILLDGEVIDAPVSLDAGVYELDVRFSLVDLDSLPIWAAVSVKELPPNALIGTFVTHDIADAVPVIHAMPSAGSSNGGLTTVISGFGFEPVGETVVHFGNRTFTSDDFLWETESEVSFKAPSHPPGSVFVTIETPQGTSATRLYNYLPTGTPPEVEFELIEDQALVNQPVAGTWGRDGRFYVGMRTGEVTAITYDDLGIPVATEVYAGVSNEEHVEILGMTTSPWSVDGDIVLYVAHTTLYAFGGGLVLEEAPYIGRVSILRGPDFDAPVPFITGLPTSNHDHGPNALVFDHNGDLLIASGGTTNAGIQSTPMGALSESPLSGALLKARTSDPAFTGDVTYRHITTNEPINDQNFGYISQLTPGGFISAHASGLRNTFDFTLATNGYLYGTDNGPNFGLGLQLLDEVTLGEEAAGLDEVVLIEAGNYYGHPNLSRGKTNAAEFSYHDEFEPSIPNTFTQALGIVDSSTNGIIEYRATTFWSQWRSQLLVQRFNGLITRLVMSPDDRHIDEMLPVFPPSGGLNIRSAPGGSILSMAYSGGVVRTLRPVDANVNGLVAYDVHPWRAPRTGGMPFVIGGKNFESIDDTTVFFGDVPATLTSVSPSRIRGIVPALPDSGTELISLVVVSGEEASVIGDAFRALYEPGNEPGRWLPTNDMPVDLSDVASAELDGTIYVVGNGHPATLTHDPYDGTWSATTASQRLIEGRGQVACAFDGKLYIVGGLGAASAGKLQIYDPVTDLWTFGADLPWAGGSLAVSTIDSAIIIAGGTVAGVTSNRCASYDPATDTWTEGAPMPSGRHFAAAGVLGGRMWIFGGWSSQLDGTFISDHTEIQIYDPSTDSWLTSETTPSLIPMPVGRGGCSRAVFWQGEFYFFGGALITGDNDAVLDRVDAYNPTTLTWRQDARMPTGRQGIAPVLFEGRTIIPGGGATFDVMPSATTETFTRQ